MEVQTRKVTRHLNQLHNVLARVFPELTAIVRELGCRSVLALLRKYPVPEKIARALLASIEATYDEGGARTVSDTRKSEHGKPHKYGDDAAARSLTIR